MFVKKVNLDRVSAVENLFGRYITDAKLETNVQKKGKRMKEPIPSNIEINFNTKNKSRNKDKFGFNETNNTNENSYSKRKKCQGSRNYFSPGNNNKSYIKFENPIVKLSEFFYNSQVKSENDSGVKDKYEKDRICNLIMSLFCSSERQAARRSAKNCGIPELVINETKSLRIAKNKSKTNKHYHKKQISTRVHHSMNIHKKELHRQHKHRKSEEKPNCRNFLQNNDLLELLRNKYETELNKYLLMNRDMLKHNKITRENTNHIVNKKNEKHVNQNLKQSCDIENSYHRSTTPKTTDKSTQYNFTKNEKRNRAVSKFSYQRNFKADEKSENIDKNISSATPERLRHFWRGDEEKVNVEYNNANSKSNKKESAVAYVTDEDRKLMREIQSLAKRIQISQSQISYVVQFSDTGYNIHNRTFSQVMEEAHFGKPLVVKNGKGHPGGPVNMPVEEEEFWRSGARLSKMCAAENFYETDLKRNRDVLESSKDSSLEKFVILPTQNNALDNNVKEIEEKNIMKKRKRSKCIDIIRRCLCLGKSKSSSEISKKSEEPIWRHPVNELYVVTDDPARGNKENKKTKRRPRFKVKPQKIKNNKRLKKLKSSKLSCCIEWKGDKEGQVIIGKQCLHFKIDKWININRGNDVRKEYILEAGFA